MNKKSELYRDPRRGKIGGVCAGISDYFGIELWLVRILFITALLLASAPLLIVSYVACIFILEKKPAGHSHNNESSVDSVHVKSRVWQTGEPPRQALQDLHGRLSHIDERIQKMERYVTSPEFTVKREIDRL